MCTRSFRRCAAAQPFRLVAVRGEQQMLVLGRALVGAPRLLMFDEPSLGLAPIVVERVMATIREVGESVPILLVEQNTSAALSVCSRGMVIANGVIVMEGEASDFEDRSALLASYLGAPTGLPGDDGLEDVTAMTNAINAAISPEPAAVSRTDAPEIQTDVRGRRLRRARFGCTPRRRSASNRRTSWSPSASSDSNSSA